MISSKLQIKRSGPTRFFPDVCISCSKELESLGFLADVYLIPGGVGVRFSSDRQLNQLSKLAHLPIREFDFSKVDSISPQELRGFDLKGLFLPKNCSFPFREFKTFKLARFSAVNSQASDFESLAILPLEELNLSGCEVEQLNFLHSMPLACLDLSRTKVNDLRPLHEKNLIQLNLAKTKVENLCSLSDCSLEKLNLNETVVFDLEPLRGSPLRQLEMRATQINDLGPLMESPLECLILPGSPITSITPLTACPLRELNLVGLKLNDLSPLLEMRLSSLWISPLGLSSEDFSLLEKVSTESLLGPGDPFGQSVADFILKYR